ncbi:hypothetical protein AVEN_41571-1 [Araneus ventricosus]|uniref:Uncharacterized protein n=1 Tax=Araneus ventricosus TaxID=182803 RepID=A0A4Y2JAM8_ARAVE|nr:hypothetical protein AVEN_41571-1 [Araneus ventricosus]
MLFTVPRYGPSYLEIGMHRKSRDRVLAGQKSGLPVTAMVWEKSRIISEFPFTLLQCVTNHIWSFDRQCPPSHLDRTWKTSGKAINTLFPLLEIR